MPTSVFLQRAVESIQTQVYKRWTSINMFLIRGCCTGYIYIFHKWSFCIKKKETVLSICDEQAPFISLRQILETKMVSFFFFEIIIWKCLILHNIIDYEQVWMSINVLHLPTYQVFLFNSSLSVIMKTRCTETLYVHFIYK